LTYVVTPSTTESVSLSNARKDFLERLNSSKEFIEFPKEAFIENLMIKALIENNLDFKKAFLSLPEDIKVFFICSYESYLFNKMVSRRIEKLGKSALKKQKGDVLLNGLPSALMPGINSTFAGGIQGEIEKEVMKEEGVEFKDFSISHAGGLKCQGKRRTIFSLPKNLKLVSISNDELNKGKTKITLSFFLDKGCYATTFLGRLIEGLM
jgi:tRNA pseudouridine13 synthase